MCLVVYLASDRLLPTIPWDESAPAFHVTRDEPALDVVAAHFSKPQRYYVGSDQGCGCGFRREYYEYVDDVEELASTRENHRRLQEFIATSLLHQPAVELYSCWSGDESLNVEHRQEVNLHELLSEGFHFLERQLTTVSR